ncbi:ATP-GRASP peptide maturase, grasp-with-spasm system [Pedobacter westerhofensis]|uniref:ATP-GRASP peptide maturase, grasp-with-spasm system n=1 Tax=Pedobacter westerhofensis TaxID=425512 RepID=A0A521FSK8_9SPHI|nr:grasp-with-spasm system ATP-grasp peptide maturase [Pedobacter westerhofensis]SMO99142.1 ATP-GRASP peptide maturase, grasp-with-spasm system [Pedobacter westerhofensis]
MILILTTHGDHSTDQTIDWLTHYKAKYQRININDLLVDQTISYKIDSTQDEFTINNKSSKDFTVIWFRKSGVFRSSYLMLKSKSILKDQLSSFLSFEYAAFVQSLKISFKNVTWLCDIESVEALDKTKQLILASKAGLDIPKSLITNDKNCAAEFVKKLNGKSIIKPLAESEIFNAGDAKYSISPKLLTQIFFKALKTKKFLPSLIQEYLDKDIELRIFFLDGDCYAMAIFSQLDNQTKIDYRNYNFDKPNRYVPYALPTTVIENLKCFMRDVGLNTGSIDMIKTKCGRMVFLEVNPKGQYDMLSNPCNYFLEEKIAKSLINKLN